ncbi:putative ubiquinone biosynthesis monooxygenase [Metarhizium acridum]|nr:putative ubiquinone biosynthesis monooxygenase [Metarhizium acridum]
MTENLNLTSGLLKRLKELGSVDIFDNSRVEKIDLGRRDRRCGPPRLARRTPASRAVGGITGRHGLVATLRLEGEGWGGQFSKIAYQRFLPTGPVAMLPLPGNYSTLVWSTTPENAALLKKLSPKDFVALVNAAFRLSPVDLGYMHTQTEGQEDEYDWRIQHTPVDAEAIPQTAVGVQEGSIASFPLKLRHADTYIGERIALVGDAAHTVHPLAGQGLNIGQGDVQSLVKAIEYAVSTRTRSGDTIVT